MIKLKVEWHRKCPNCGTELVSDLFNDYAHSSACPWCGSTMSIASDGVNSETKARILDAVKTLEEEANNSVIAQK